MPTYEYRCRDCDHTFDAYQSFSDDPLTECPECGGSLKKVFGNVGIAFKGSGFYKTDSRGGSSKAASPASSTDAASSSSSSDSSTKDSSAKDSSAPAPAKAKETSSSTSAPAPASSAS